LVYLSFSLQLFHAKVRHVSKHAQCVAVSFAIWPVNYFIAAIHNGFPSEICSTPGTTDDDQLHTSQVWLCVVVLVWKMRKSC